MTFRIEKKYRLTKSEQLLIKSKLIKKGMKILYPSREINNCYFDTKDLRCFFESEEGMLPRKKIRIRWYKKGLELFKEKKISSIEGRFKVSEKFHNESFLKNFKHTFFENSYGKLKSKIIINYTREYYLLDGMRITFDSSINYRNIGAVYKKKFFDNETVMEVKTSIDHPLDLIEENINITDTRFSKYCRGITYTRKNNP